MKDFLTRISSRKFIALFAGEVAAFAAIFKVELHDPLYEAIVRGLGIVAAIAVAWGYIKMEGEIDKAGVENGK